MKLCKKLLLWISLSLIFQLGILWFIDSVYLQRRTEFIEVTEYSKNIKLPGSVTLKMADGMTKVKVSYDARYAGHLEDGALRVIDFTGGKKDMVIKKGKGEIKYYNWLPDRNIAIYAFLEDGFMNVETYDADGAITRDYPKIEWKKGYAEIFGIELSPYTNTVYVIVDTISGSKAVYKYDIVDELSYIASIRDIKSACHRMFSDMLIYQNGKGQIFTLSGKGTPDITELYAGERVLLLGAGIDGYVYIGVTDEKGYIEEIAFGGINDAYPARYRHIGLKESVPAGDVQITAGGRVYIVSEGENRIFNAENDKGMQYPGRFIQTAGSYVISFEGDQLMLTPISGLH